MPDPESPSIPANYLKSVVEARRAHQKAIEALDIGDPGEPPELPKSPNWRLQWKAAGAANQISGAAISIDELRREMPLKLKRYIADPGDESALLVKVAAGGGKTHTGVAIAQWAVRELGWRVLWCGPRHDMFEELKLFKHFDASLWYHWKGLQWKADDPDEAVCRFADAQRQWAEKGYPTMRLCQQLCGQMRDNWISQCPYRCQQKRKERIVYAQHHHLITGLAIQNFKLVIVDELPLGSFLNHRVISKEEIDKVSNGMIGPLRDLLNSTIAAINTGKTLKGKPLFDRIGAHMRDVYELEDDEIVSQYIAQQIPHVSNENQVQHAATWFVEDLLKAAAIEHKAWTRGWDVWQTRISTDKEGLHIKYGSQLWKHLPNKIVALDATANPELYRMMLDKTVKVYHPEIRRKGWLKQVAGRLNGKSSLDNEGSQHALDAFNLVEEIARPYKEKKQRVAVISHKSVEPLFVKEFGEQNYSYFYNTRGSNEQEGADCLIVVGTPSPPLESVVDFAAALDPLRARPFLPEDEDGAYRPLFGVQEREYRLTGPARVRHGGKSPWRNISGFWHEPELQAVLNQMREAELMQALHRSRINARECDVWLLTSTPTGEALDGVWDDPPPELGFPEGIPWKQWLKIKKYVEGLPEDELHFRPENLVEVTGCSLSYIKRMKWVHIAAASLPNWQLIAERTGKRGYPPKIAERAS